LPRTTPACVDAEGLALAVQRQLAHQLSLASPARNLLGFPSSESNNDVGIPASITRRMQPLVHRIRARNWWGFGTAQHDFCGLNPGPV
jgi:hypothetical protein